MPTWASIYIKDGISNCLIYQVKHTLSKLFFQGEGSEKRNR